MVDANIQREEILPSERAFAFKMKLEALRRQGARTDLTSGHHKILDKMIFLWRESKEETCSLKNPYEAEYDKASDEFHKKYGDFGFKLQTEEELEANRKRGGGGGAIENDLFYQRFASGA